MCLTSKHLTKSNVSIPGHASIVEPLLTIKLHPESSFEVISVLVAHDGSIRVLKEIASFHRDFKHSREVTLKQRLRALQFITVHNHMSSIVS